MNAPGDRAKLLTGFGLPESKKFVTIVANLRSPVKNHRMFLRSAAMVKENFPDAKFIIAGEGELTQELKEFARGLGLEDDAFLLGDALMFAACFRSRTSAA